MNRVVYQLKGNYMIAVGRKSLMILGVLGLLLMAGEGFAADGDRSAGRVRTELEKRLATKVCIDQVDVPIGLVIRQLADKADVDIVKSPKVVGNVTAKLTDVPLEEALENILAAHGYGYVTTENMIRVAPLEELQEKSEMLVSKIYRITYADVEDVEEALGKFLSSRGSLSANVGTSNIIVSDTESKIKAIDMFIQEIDRITPQIVVEAKIYDISNDKSLDVGVDWFAGTRTTFDADGLAEDVAGSETNPFYNSQFGSGISNAESTTGLIRFGILNDNLNIDATLRLEQETSCAELLANPRILVLDNETANIKIVEEVPFQQLTQTGEGGNLGTTEFKEVGVMLEVTPHLTRDDMIRLKLRPEFSVQVDTVAIAIPTGGEPIQAPQPIVDRRTALTTALIRDGQTVVIGGLRKKETRTEVSKVPILGDIPLLGGLFKFEGENVVNSELVVFITPRIVREHQLTGRERDNLKALDFCGPECPEPKLNPCEADGE